MSQIKKYIWLINTIQRAGKISLADLSDRYQRNKDMSYGEPLNRQTFNRWRGEIFDVFGVIIECTKGAGYRYYIENPESLTEDVTGWLLDTYDTAGTLSCNLALRDRIVVDDVPSSHDFLEPIVGAMKESRTVSLTYRSFGKERAHTFPVEPYCLRMFNRRWYMLGHSVNDDRLRLYALDRMEDVEPTKEKFRLPKDFNAKDYFASYFGVTLDDEVEEQRVVLRADRYHKHYLRTLPLHPSQRELPGSDDGETADFELHLRPGYEFCMELLRAGAMIEVLEPQSLRHAMHGWASDLWEMYKDD